MMLFNLDTDRILRPIAPGVVPGRYDVPAPVSPAVVPLRSTPSGRIALSGKPLNAVEISDSVQPPSACFLKPLLLFLKNCMNTLAIIEVRLQDHLSGKLSLDAGRVLDRVRNPEI